MKHVLLIEPDDIVASLYGDALVQHGYEVAFAKSAQQAIAQADKQLPDVVVLELQMARHNGVEFMYEFKSYTEWQNVPVIILTSLPARELARYQSLSDQLQVVATLKKSETTAVLLVKAVDAVIRAGQP
jgi:CheY-like chemotaxis protein